MALLQAAEQYLHPCPHWPLGALGRRVLDAGGGGGGGTDDVSLMISKSASALIRLFSSLTIKTEIG